MGSKPQINILYLYTLVFTVGIFSCDKKENKIPELLLDSRYQQIDSISTLANCNGPRGKYLTKIVSKKDGYLHFLQIYKYNEDATFIAELTSENKGFVIDENKNIIDTLSNISALMIRSHDFHRLLTNPNLFFDDITFNQITKNNLELYTARDKLNNPVKIYYNKSTKQISDVIFLNMMDTTETIKIRTEKWIDSKYGKMTKEIEIIQAKKDTFNFNFERIELSEIEN